MQANPRSAAAEVVLRARRERLRGPELQKLACPPRLVEAGTGSAPGPLARQRTGFARFQLRGRRSFLVRPGADFAAGAALLQGEVEIVWQARDFCQRFRSRRSTFPGSGADFVAGAAVLQAQAQLDLQREIDR